MRSDAANLLSRLGQTKFRYQEFSDNFADMELWPLFEALIRDSRISGHAARADDGMSLLNERGASERGQAAPQRSPVPQKAPVKAEPRPGGLFGRYDDAAFAPRAGDGAQDDIRSLLRKLNDRVEQGEL